MIVKVVEYNPQWIELYEIEKREILNFLGDTLVAIHHIGSTAVKGLKSKPIIDIIIVIEKIEELDYFNVEFEKLGYECMGEFGMSGRRYFRKGGDNRTHQIHAFGVKSKFDIDRHLAVRNYLREFPDVANEYGELKEKVASQNQQDIDGYCDGKDKFVKELEAKALNWYNKKVV